VGLSIRNLIAKRDYERAIRGNTTSVRCRCPACSAFRAQALALSGGAGRRLQNWIACLTCCRKRATSHAYDIALIHAALADAENAFLWLERAMEDRSTQLVFLAQEPMFSALHADPRCRLARPADRDLSSGVAVNREQMRRPHFVSDKQGALGERAARFSDIRNSRKMRIYPIGSLLLLTLLQPDTANAVNLDQHGLTGSWFNPATGGQGIELEVYPDSAAQATACCLQAGSPTTRPRRRPALVRAERRCQQRQRECESRHLYAVRRQLQRAAGARRRGQSRACDVAVRRLQPRQPEYAFTDGSGRAGTIPLLRLTANVTCAAGGDDSSAASSYLLSGNWFNTDSGGQGFIFDFNPVQNNLFAAWYTFAPDGQQIGGPASQRWYVLQAAYTPGMTSVTNMPIAIGTGRRVRQPGADADA
jgi:hypothetical protein